ncbi:Protein kinase domain-containing protein [Aphelenchoides besseyi]|nr:Protein kinase domain-containing protein [Aphelenchoides besseyi]KAI6198882.1 Protein kinase domain-containing protein [Aphelenchoides besseyi]
MEFLYDQNENLLLGSGAFGTCKLALDPQSRRRVVLKYVTRKNEKMLRDEWNLHAELRYPFIVEAYALIDQPQSSDLIMVLEYVSGGDLRKYLKNKPMAHSEVLRFTVQMAMALEYLHDRCILHRDLKPENILLSGGDIKSIRLCDFGVACNWKRNVTELNQFTGTHSYMAPEIFNKTITANGLSDMWSLGCIVYEMFTGQKAFPQATSRLQIQQISYKPMGNDVEQIGHFIVTHLIIEVGYRLSASQVLQIDQLQKTIEKIWSQSCV